MINKKIYIFSGNSRASRYGVGTYITQLIDCLKETTVQFGLIYIYAEGDEVTVTEKEGYQLISIPATRSLNQKNDQHYSRNIAYLLKEFIAESKETEYIFHLNFMTNDTLVYYLRKMFKCKIILVAHYSNWSFTLLGNQSKLENILNKKSRLRDYSEKKIVGDIKKDTKMISKCDKFVCIAQHSLKSFSEICHVDTQKVILINNALKDCYNPITKESKDAIKQKYYFTPNTRLLLFAGRLDEVKGVSFLIQAFRNILKSNTDIRLIIAGDGDFNQWFKEANDIWAKITFTGRIEKETLYELYQIADIGIVSSIHEEFGFVAIEMMMHQLPIIVTDTGGLAEIVENGISGLKIPITNDNEQKIVDTTALSNQIELLIKCPETAQIIGKNARKRFLEKYELSIFKQNMLSLYQSI